METFGSREQTTSTSNAPTSSNSSGRGGSPSIAASIVDQQQMNAAAAFSSLIGQSIAGGQPNNPAYSSMFPSPFESVPFPELFTSTAVQCDICPEVCPDQQTLYIHRNSHYFDQGMFANNSNMMDNLWLHSTPTSYVSTAQHQQMPSMPGATYPSYQQFLPATHNSYVGPLVHSSMANIAHSIQQQQQQIACSSPIEIGSTSSPHLLYATQNALRSAQSAQHLASIIKCEQSPSYVLDQNRQPSQFIAQFGQGQQPFFDHEMKANPHYESPSTTTTTTSSSRRSSGGLKREPATKAANRARPAEAKPYECDLCGMKIKHKRNIYRHKRTRHNMIHVSDGSGNIINRAMPVTHQLTNQQTAAAQAQFHHQLMHATQNLTQSL